MTTTEPTERLVSAALRHIRDAEHLLENGPQQSVDQAFHLAGFAPECIRKACLRTSFHQPIGHTLFDDVPLETALALDPHSARYPLRSWDRRWRALQRWRVQARYDRTGTADREHTRQLVAACRDAVTEVTLALYADGALPTGALR